MTPLIRRTTLFRTAVLAVLLPLLFTGCGDDTPVNPDKPSPLGESKIYSNRANGSSADIVWMDADGSNQQIFRQNAALTSPPQGDRMLLITESEGLILTDLDGNMIRSIPTVHNPKRAILSPDGNVISYAYWDYTANTRQVYTIRTVRADGTGDALLTTQGGWENTMTFSPDSKRIAFYLDEEFGQPDKLYTVNTDGTDMKLVTDNALSINDRFGGVVWSANGDRLLFSRTGDNGEPQIWSIKPDGSDPLQLTDASVPGGYFPRFSPDGTMVAFSGMSNIDEGAELWVMQSDGSSKRQLTNTPGTDEVEVFPEWSPDGTSILYVSFEIPEQGDAFTGALKTIDVATGTTKVLIETPDIHGAFWIRK